MRFITDYSIKGNYYVEAEGILISYSDEPMRETAVVDFDGILYCIAIRQTGNTLIKPGETIHIAFATHNDAPKISIHEYYKSHR